MVMSVIERYQDIGIDPMKATEIMELLGVTPTEFIDPARFKRFQETARFLSKYENYPYLIKKLTVGKQVDRLNHLWEWVVLAERKEALASEFAKASTEEREMESVKDNLEYLDKYAVVKHKVDIALDNLKAVEAEMNIYE